MKKEYKLNFKNQYNSSKKCFNILLWLLILLPFIIYFKKGNFSIEIFIFAIIFWLLTSFTMILPFHIQYLIKNWNTKLIINETAEKIEIYIGKTVNIFKFSEIETQRHILGHYKPGRHKSWTPIPFDYYGYVNIKTNDDRNFAITSLIADPFKFPLKIDSTIYGFPFIKKEITKKDIESIKATKTEETERRINYFIENFKSISIEELKKKLENEKVLDKNAKIAIERILESKK